MEQLCLEECYKKAGFRDVAVRAVPVQRHFPSTTEAVSAMKGSFPRLQTLLTNGKCAIQTMTMMG